MALLEKLAQLQNLVRRDPSA
jgi:protein SDA1